LPIHAVEPYPERKVALTARQAIKRLARPFTGRLFAQVDTHISAAWAESATRTAHLEAHVAALEEHISSLETHISSLQADVEGMHRYLPTIINTISSQNAAKRHGQRRLDAVEDRVEVVRKELLFELHYGDDAGRDHESAHDFRVIDKEKLEQSRGDIRLNLGAGQQPRPDYLNVDTRELPGIDITADLRNLPFLGGEVREIFSAHLLEQFRVEELRRSLLPHWVSLLQDGGKLVAVVSDTEALVKARAEGHLAFSEFIAGVYGDDERDQDAPRSGFSKASLTSLLEEAGLDDVTVRVVGKRGGHPYELEFEGVRHPARPS
jgi:exonuclease VII small subunit